MATGANFEIRMTATWRGHCNICGWDGPIRTDRRVSDEIHQDWVKHRDAEHPGATVWPGKEDWETSSGPRESNRPQTTMNRESLRDRLRS